jgi:hypothetical protein
MLVVIIGELLLFISGVATGIIFRKNISAALKSALRVVKSKADEAEKVL